MYGTNPTVGRVTKTGDEYQVANIFLTVQGEGPFAGHPAVFVRLTGCPLHCAFCDTVWDDTNDPRMSAQDILQKAVSLWPDTNNVRPRFVVITGGEPTRWPLLPLLQRFKNFNGFDIQIETAGVYDVSEYAHLADFVVSPKTDIVHPSVNDAAQYWKYPLDAMNIDENDGLPNFIQHTVAPTRGFKLFRPRRPPIDLPRKQIFVTPIDTGNEDSNASNRAVVSRVAIAYGYTAGLQLHKFMGVE